uniref:Uncharacterized protein n=1 Tax=Amazona collaria TaxID=241587 RepID=A0A8B9G187_9PSIT
CPCLGPEALPVLQLAHCTPPAGPGDAAEGLWLGGEGPSKQPCLRSFQAPGWGLSSALLQGSRVVAVPSWQLRAQKGGPRFTLQRRALCHRAWPRLHLTGSVRKGCRGAGELGRK